MKKLSLIKVITLILLIHVSLFPEIVEKIEVSSEEIYEKMISRNLIILNKETFYKFGIQKVSDVFRLIPGVHIARRGGGDTSYDISIRGGNFEQVRVMINGVPFNNPQTGHFNCDFPFTIDDIERIEISRSSGSVSHGAGGSSGEINIILKSKMDIGADISIGDKSFFKSGLRFGKRSEKFEFGISTNLISSSGYHKGQEFNNQYFNSTFAYRSKSQMLKANAGFVIKQFGAENFYAPFPSKEKTDSGNVHINYKNLGPVEHDISVSIMVHNDDFTLDRNNKNFFNSRARSVKNVFKYQNYFSLNDLVFSSGIDVDSIQINSSTFGKHSIMRGGLFLKSGLKRMGWGADFGARVNLSNDYQSDLSFYAGIYKIFKNNLVIKGSYADNVRYPSFTELYYHSPANIGDENLFIEKTRNLECSLDLPFRNINFGFTAFYRKQKNMIDWIKNDTHSAWRVVNIPENEFRGYEISANYNRYSFSIITAFEKIVVPDYKFKFFSKYGYRFPDMKLSFYMKRSITKSIDLMMNAVYKRMLESKENGYLIDMVVKWKHKNFIVSVIMENILNSIIEEIPGLQIPGRWLIVNIKYSK